MRSRDVRRTAADPGGSSKPLEVIPPEGCFQMPELPYGRCTSTPQLPGMPLREVRETLQRPRQQDWEAGQRAGHAAQRPEPPPPPGRSRPGETLEAHGKVRPVSHAGRCPGVTERRRIPRSATDGV